MSRLPARRPGSVILPAIAALASGMALQAAPAAWAQDYELVPQSPGAPSETGISLRATIDVMFTPPGASEPVLVQKAFETRAAAINLSSQYVFDVLNEAALAGVEQVIAGGGQAGRVSIVAVCYMHAAPDSGAPVLTPMGVYINTTDLNVLPDGNAAVRTRYKIVPPGR